MDKNSSNEKKKELHTYSSRVFSPVSGNRSVFGIKFNIVKWEETKQMLGRREEEEEERERLNILHEEPPYTAATRASKYKSVRRRDASLFEWTWTHQLAATNPQSNHNNVEKSKKTNFKSH